jgi:hypothetical protein
LRSTLVVVVIALGLGATVAAHATHMKHSIIFSRRERSAAGIPPKPA